MTYDSASAAFVVVQCLLQGAKVAVYAATSPTLSADQPVPLFLHHCKPLKPSVSAAADGAL